MKKTNKENPLTFFRKANESRQKVVKNSLAKARNGIVAGPQTEMQSILSNAMNSQPPIPRPNRPSRDEMMKQMMIPSSANIDSMNKSMNDKAASRSNATNAARMAAMDKQTINAQAVDKYKNSKSAAMSQEMYKAKMDAMTNRPKSNTPMMDSMFKQKQGGAVKRKK